MDRLLGETDSGVFTRHFDFGLCLSGMGRCSELRCVEHVIEQRTTTQEEGHNTDDDGRDHTGAHGT